MIQQVAFTVPSTINVTNQQGEALELAEGTRLEGTISLDTWAGAWGIVEYDHPSFMKVEFRCTGPGRLFVYHGILTGHDLLFLDGEVATESTPPSPGNACDPIMEVIDSRTTIRPIIDGGVRPARTKYMGATFTLYLTSETLRIHCRYFDGECDGGYREIWYERPLATLLFFNATRIYRDADGNMEDWDPHGEKFVEFTFGEGIRS